VQFLKHIRSKRRTGIFLRTAAKYEEFAVERVAERVRMGGHNVPEETIRRRYHAGIGNFFRLYRPMADTWFFYDNSGSEPCLIAHGEKEQELLVNDSAIWHNIKKRYGSKRKT
jgi:predicted ABC-type ATPase